MKSFASVLRAWLNEMDYQATKRLEDGTPMLGKFETEDLYRQGRKLLKEVDERKGKKFNNIQNFSDGSLKVRATQEFGATPILEETNRVGNIEVRTRIYGCMAELLPKFTWIDVPVVVKGEDFQYEATCLCSFPKKNGKVRYIVEDNGRLFIQRREQIVFPEWFDDNVGQEEHQVVLDAIEAHNSGEE